MSPLPSAAPSAAPLERLLSAQSARLREAFLRAAGSGQHPRLPQSALAELTALLLSVLILLGYLLLVAYGVWGLYRLSQGNNMFMQLSLLITAPVALLVAWAVRPLRSRPRQQVLTPEQAPALHGLIREIAATLGTPAPARVELTAELGAQVYREKEGRVLVLGLPLLYALAPQERVALLAREQAKQPGRSRLLSEAQELLQGTINLIDARSSDTVLLWVGKTAFTLPALALLWLLQLLAGSHSQQAEFRADLQAARVAGHAAAITLLEKQHSAHLLEIALQRQRHSPQQPHALAELRQLWDLTPERRAALRHEVAQGRRRLADSQAVTADRWQVLEAWPHLPQLQPDAARMQQVEAELELLAPALAAKAEEKYQLQYSVP